MASLHARIKVDENLPESIAQMLRSSGHDAIGVRDQGLAGAPDERVAGVCRSEGRALLTFDLDFADIRLHPPESSAGFIVLRLARQDADYASAAVARIVPLLSAEDLAGKLWIVDELAVRIRGQGA